MNFDSCFNNYSNLHCVTPGLHRGARNTGTKNEETRNFFEHTLIGNTEHGDNRDRGIQEHTLMTL